MKVYIFIISLQLLFQMTNVSEQNVMVAMRVYISQIHWLILHQHLCSDYNSMDYFFVQLLN